MIKVEQLTKKYGNKTVLDHVDLELPKQQLISFIGSNGAGKSTLISLISRILEKNEGSVFIDSKELGDWKNDELSKRLSILKQSNHLNIRLTVRELVGFGRFPHSKGKLTKEDEKYIDQAIDYLGLKEIENRYLDELSGGQRQRRRVHRIVAE